MTHDVKWVLSERELDINSFENIDLEINKQCLVTAHKGGY